jgi:hypothetical protein
MFLRNFGAGRQPCAVLNPEDQNENFVFAGSGHKKLIIVGM